MIVLISELHYSWARWKGVLSIGYFAVMLIAGLLMSPTQMQPTSAAMPGYESRQHDSYSGTSRKSDGLLALADIDGDKLDGLVTEPNASWLDKTEDPAQRPGPLTLIAFTSRPGARGYFASD